MNRSGEPTRDGRHARSERSHEAVLAAVIDLLEEGHYEPTARQIATRAGVALRTVYRHFDDLDALFAAALDVYRRRVDPLQQPIDPALPLDVRIDRLSSQRRAVWEAATPIRRAGRRMRDHQPFVADSIVQSRQRSRAQLETLFAVELGAADPTDRHDLLEQLEASTSWSTWEMLRTEQELDGGRAELVVGRMLKSALFSSRTMVSSA